MRFVEFVAVALAAFAGRILVDMQSKQAIVTHIAFKLEILKNLSFILLPFLKLYIMWIIRSNYSAPIFKIQEYWDKWYENEDKW